MRTPQLLCAALLVAGTTAACNRTESEANAQRTAGDVRAAAARAGHQLADSWLTTKIQAQYFADDDIKARHINVSTRDGVVTLTGFVEGQPQRQLAVQIAKTTDGVRQVNDQLTLTGQAPESGAIATTGTADAASSTATPDVRQTLDDAQVTARVQSKFFVDERVKGRRIDVDTRGGVVTLSGEVGSEDERAQALLLARTTEGVQRVEDHLTVMPPPASSAGAVEPGSSAPAGAPRIDDTSVTTTIQARYFVDPTVKGTAVEVATRDGVVTLQGTVPSEAARKQALAIAQNTEGVVQVIDRLTVAPAVR